MEKKNNELKTVADEIWAAIKNIKIDMFALPDQLVSKYCRPVKIDPSKLFLTCSATAVLPALETALKGVYNVERVDKYICVTPIVNPFPIIKE